mmetsp:Transcript_94249/g.271559  ORF Transcript_94249/g.271559 Transcript_94249/m.271559 type:complete len:210 (+) Transcript_94249:774-1403(+)
MLRVQMAAHEGNASRFAARHFGEADHSGSAALPMYGPHVHAGCCRDLAVQRRLERPAMLDDERGRPPRFVHVQVGHLLARQPVEDRQNLRVALPAGPAFLLSERDQLPSVVQLCAHVHGEGCPRLLLAHSHDLCAVALSEDPCRLVAQVFLARVPSPQPDAHIGAQRRNAERHRPLGKGPSCRQQRKDRSGRHGRMRRAAGGETCKHPA